MFVGAALALLAACTNGGSITSTGEPIRSAGRNEPPPAIVGDVGGFVPSPIDWAPCDDDRTADCGNLDVPLDWGQPDGTKIQLAVARRPATGDRIGVLFTNPGGPGGSGVDLALGSPFSPPISNRFDIVGWDPRGVGQSTRIECGDTVDDFLGVDSSPDTPDEQTELDQAAKAVADECQNEDGDLIAHVGTDNVARDLEALRISLGEPKLTYLGFSYGTSIGLRYLALFPTNVRAMVLDGVVDPTLDLEGWLTQQARAFDDSMNRAFAACGNVEPCPVPDLAEAYDELAAKVEELPIPAGRGRQLGPSALATAAILVSYDPGAWKLLPPAIADALDGDGAAMYELAESYYDLSGFTAYASVACTDAAHPVGAEAYAAFADRLREVSPRFGESVANELLPCAFWQAPVAQITGVVRGEGSPPILVLGNRGDAATPYANSVKVAEMLADGHLVSNDDEGHTAFGRSNCVDNAVEDYLIDVAVPETDPDCGR